MTLMTFSQLRHLQHRLHLLPHPQSRSRTTHPSVWQHLREHLAQELNSPSLRPSQVPKRQTSATSSRLAHLQAHRLSRHLHSNSNSKSPQATNPPDRTTSLPFKQALLHLPQSQRQDLLSLRLRLAHSQRRRQLVAMLLPACLQVLPRRMLVLPKE